MNTIVLYIHGKGGSPKEAEHYAKTGAHLTVAEQGEHWFHTKEQMDLLDAWITKR